jgi:hypothetical protein
LIGEAGHRQANARYGNDGIKLPGTVPSDFSGYCPKRVSSGALKSFSVLGKRIERQKIGTLDVTVSMTDQKQANQVQQSLPLLLA